MDVIYINNDTFIQKFSENLIVMARPGLGLTGVRVDRGLGGPGLGLTGVSGAGVSTGFQEVLAVTVLQKEAVRRVWVKTLHRDVAGKRKVLGDSRRF